MVQEKKAAIWMQKIARGMMAKKEYEKRKA